MAEYKRQYLNLWQDNNKFYIKNDGLEVKMNLVDGNKMELRDGVFSVTDVLTELLKKDTAFASVGDAHASLAVSDGAISSLNVRVGETEQSVASMFTRVEQSMATSFGNLDNQELSVTDSKVQSIAYRIDVSENSIASLAVREASDLVSVSSLTSRELDIHDSITSLSTRASYAELSIASVLTDSDSVHASLASLGTRAGVLESGVLSVAQSIASIQDSLLSLHVRAANIDASLEAVEDNVIVAEGDLNSIKTTIAILMDGSATNGALDTLECITSFLDANPTSYNLQALDSRLFELEGVISTLTTV